MGLLDPPLKSQLASKEPFKKSLVSSIVKNTLLTVYDGFERDSTTSGPVGSTDTGQPYVQLEGTNIYNGSNLVRGLQGEGVVGIANTGDIIHTSNSNRSGFRARMNIASSKSNDRCGFYMWVDANNWFKISCSFQSLYIEQKVAGVVTTLGTVALFSGGSSPFYFNAFDLDITYSGGNNAVIAALPQLQIKSNVYTPTVITSGLDINYFAITSMAEGKISYWSIAKPPFL